jgi:hypothetical protein
MVQPISRLPVQSRSPERLSDLGYALINALQLCPRAAARYRSASAVMSGVGTKQENIAVQQIVRY